MSLSLHTRPYVWFSLIYEIVDTCLVMHRPVPAICIITAQEGNEVKQRCIEAGALELFHKPISREKLTGFIDAYLRMPTDLTAAAQGGGVAGGRSVGLMNLLRGSGSAQMENRVLDQAKAFNEWVSRGSLESSRTDVFETI